jgi:hypothetical protein
VLVAGAAAGVIDTALGASTSTTATTAGTGANTAPANATLDPAQVPGYLIPLFTGAAKSSRCGLTPALLAAQSKVESGYQPDAISTAGAVGIMQFLPSTWASEGIDADHDGIASITDPADAIYSAARLDCKNLADIQHAGIHDDQTALMLAAYNAGLGTVLDCRCQPPIGETVRYVANIEQLAATLASVPAPPQRPAAAVEMVYPLAVHGMLTQTYGQHADGFHPGADLAAPYGTTLLAATAGTITYAGWETGYGNYICLADTLRLSTCYGHLALIAVNVGQTVTQAEPLGAEGSSGNSTGPHLHFEVRINGETVDPAGYVSLS